MIVKVSGGSESVAQPEVDAAHSAVPAEEAIRHGTVMQAQRHRPRCLVRSGRELGAQ